MKSSLSLNGASALAFSIASPFAGDTAGIAQNGGLISLGPALANFFPSESLYMNRIKEDVTRWLNYYDKSSVAEVLEGDNPSMVAYLLGCFQELPA